MNFTKNNLLKLSFLAIASLSFIQCGNDDSTIDSESSDYYVGIDYGSDFADFLSTAESLSEGTISPVGNGFEQLSWSNYTQGIDQIFSRTETELISYEKDENGNLVEGLAIKPNLHIYAHEVLDESTMLALGSPWYNVGVKEFYVIDTDAMSVTKTVVTNDLPSFANSETDFLVSMPTSLKVIGSNLFVSYLLEEPGEITGELNVANIAVYSYPELEFVKIISDDRGSTIGRYYSQFGMATDESDNLYAICPSSISNGYSSASVNKSSVLKIKNGETNFDADYYLDFETLSGGYKLSDIFYVSGGKAVVSFATDDSASWGSYGWAETLGYGILDLESFQFTDLSGDMELSSGGFNGTVLVEGTTAYIAVSNSTYSGIYVLDVETGSVSEGADVDGNSVKGILSLK